MSKISAAEQAHNVCQPQHRFAGRSQAQREIKLSLSSGLCIEEPRHLRGRVGLQAISWLENPSVSFRPV